MPAEPGSPSFIRRGSVLLGVAALVTLAYVLVQRARPPAAVIAVDENAAVAGLHPHSLVAEPTTLLALEARGFTLNRVLGAPGVSTKELTESRAYADLLSTLTADLQELDARPGIGGEQAMNHPFKASWLSDDDARFELVGVVPRLDRAFAEPGTCGEIRLVYRLALTRKGRPGTRLPMTLSVLMIVHGDSSTCKEVTTGFLNLPDRGQARVAALASILTRRTASPRRIEVNVQNLHGPSVRKDSDDHAEYLLRSFDVTPRGLSPHPLLNTPREDLGPDEKKALLAVVKQRFAEIDQGTFVMPESFAARRAISVAPRGLARKRNRVFQALLGEGAQKELEALPYASAKLVKSPAALLRRLDEGTCQGCHESRSVAGFHLLGEERTADTFNTLAVGRSNHLEEELPWRERFLEAVAQGAVYIEPRPFAERATPSGGYGARCGMGDPGFAALGCAPGLACKDFIKDELGACTHAGENREGDACERATVTHGAGPDGDSTTPDAKEPCTIHGALVPSDACSPNAYGFPGGMCSDACDELGQVTGDAICAPLPAAGYESDCFATDVPIETCIKTHLAKRRVRACDEKHACRDDFACVRVPNAPAGTGACVPPYFVFQARVDGPRTDR
jgi:hypothetical protein